MAAADGTRRAGQDASAANIEQESRFGEIFAEVGDATYGHVRSIFLPGKGRPSTSKYDPQKQQCTHRFLLQVFKLKTEHGKSWDTIVQKLYQTFVVYPLKKYRPLIEKVLREVLNCDPEARKEFYDTVIDLNSVGQFADAAGLNRTALNSLDLQPLQSEYYTHGLLLDLDRYSNDTDHLWALVELLMPNLFTCKKTLRERIKAIKMVYQKRNKAKSKNNKAQEYLNENMTKTELPTTCTLSRKRKVSQATEADQMKNASPDVHSKRPKQLEKSQEQLDTLKHQLTAFKEMCYEKNQGIKVLETENELQKSQLKKQAIKLDKLRNNCKFLKSSLLKANIALKSARKGALYQQLQRKKKYYNERENLYQRQLRELKPDRVKKLRQAHRNTQKSLSDQKKVTDLLHEENKRLKDNLWELKHKCEELESELLFIKDTTRLKTRYESNQFTLEVEKCCMELATECEISAQKCSRVIQTVIRNIFSQQVSTKDLPSENTVINMVDRAQVLAKYQVAEEMAESEEWDYHFDGTTRDSRKILGQQVTLSTGKTLSAGFVGMVQEDSTTLVNNAMDMIAELADIYDEQQCDIFVKDFLKKMCATMSDRASVNKCFARKFAEVRQEKLDMEIETHLLFCNAHFLLGLSNESEKILKSIEKNLEEESGQQLGRNSNAKFAHFRGKGESGTGRFIRTASDVFGPRGDEKNGCRSDWLAYCAGVVQLKSRVSSFRMNRFNNFFAGAAALYFHQTHIQEFLSTFKDNLNMKLESVKLDCMCTNLQALVKALGILFFKVTGPYWNLLHAEIEYVDLYKYVQRMHQQLSVWVNDVTSLMDKDSPSVFPEFKSTHRRDEVVYDFVFSPMSEGQQVTEGALKQLVEGFLRVTERQLADFLPGGQYGQEPSIERRRKLKHSKLTNLVGENAFGDLDFSQYKRRNASMHYHSGIHMVKTNKTISKWLSSKCPEDEAKLVQLAHENSVNLRKKHRQKEAQLVKRQKEKLEMNRKNVEEKRAAKQVAREKLMKGIKEYGGLCQCPKDVDELVKDLPKAEQTKALKLQMQYQKEILNNKDKLLLVTRKSPAELADNLKMFLGHEPHSVTSNEEGITPNSPIDSDSEYEDGDDLEKEPESALSAEIDKFGSFKFRLQGEYIAVAYEEDFHIGMVTSVTNEDCATVQFLRKGYNKTYKWPSVLLIDDVESKFVFYGQVDLTTNNNGRTWSIVNLEKIQKLYSCYSDKFF